MNNLHITFASYCKERMGSVNILAADFENLSYASGIHKTVKGGHMMCDTIALESVEKKYFEELSFEVSFGSYTDYHWTFKFQIDGREETWISKIHPGPNVKKIGTIEHPNPKRYGVILNGVQLVRLN